MREPLQIDSVSSSPVSRGEPSEDRQICVKYKCIRQIYLLKIHSLLVTHGGCCSRLICHSGKIQCHSTLPLCTDLVSSDLAWKNAHERDDRRCSVISCSSFTCIMTIHLSFGSQTQIFLSFQQCSLQQAYSTCPRLLPSPAQSSSPAKCKNSDSYKRHRTWRLAPCVSGSDSSRGT